MTASGDSAIPESSVQLVNVDSVDIRRKSSSSILLGVAGACVIANSAILIRLSGQSPATVALFRCGYALPPLILLSIFERARRGPRSGRSHRYSLLAGVLFGGTILCQNYAIDAVGAAIATVVSNLQVVFVTLAGWLLFAERPSGRFFLALPPALIGVLLVSGSISGGQHAVSTVGILFCIGTSIAYAAFMIALRHGQRAGDVHVVGPLAEVTVVAALVVGLLGVAGGQLDLVPPWPAQGWLLLLALGPQVAGWLSITMAMRRIPIALAALLLLLQPMVAVVLAMVLLHERLSVYQLAGSVVLLAAVVFASRGRVGDKSARG